MPRMWNTWQRKLHATNKPSQESGHDLRCDQQFLEWGFSMPWHPTLHNMPNMPDTDKRFNTCPAGLGIVLIWFTLPMPCFLLLESECFTLCHCILDVWNLYFDFYRDLQLRFWRNFGLGLLSNTRIEDSEFLEIKRNESCIVRWACAFGG